MLFRCGGGVQPETPECLDLVRQQRVADVDDAPGIVRVLGNIALAEPAKALNVACLLRVPVKPRQVTGNIKHGQVFAGIDSGSRPCAYRIHVKAILSAVDDLPQQNVRKTWFGFELQRHVAATDCYGGTVVPSHFPLPGTQAQVDETPDHGYTCPGRPLSESAEDEKGENRQAEQRIDDGN